MVFQQNHDGRGSLHSWCEEQLIFPEINDDVDKTRGLDICYVTTANTDEGVVHCLGWNAFCKILGGKQMAKKSMITRTNPWQFST